ncbi:ABC transporter permease [Salinarimonas ramus]|uniref:Tungstate ABC transporter permease n=1 Tax=Salinarimonas ramus TaxID=690164 RepID=A0A917Q3R9_9HYPH|nr:ABC transporter permease [Salinarimonas ramus]GGK21247.1 tungstate ABC transporter permease [Salinarimonas ramus]
MLQIALFTIFVSAAAATIAVALAILLSLTIIRQQSRLARIVLVTAQSLNAIPPTVVGVFFYYLCANSEWMANLLFTPTGMIVGQIILGLPIAYFLFAALISESIMKLSDLGMRDVNGAVAFHRPVLFLTVIWDIKARVITNAFVIFGRLVGEVGAILIIGGGIRGSTETLSTNIVMQTHMGDIETALQSGMLLLGIVVVTRLVILAFEGKTV